MKHFPQHTPPPPPPVAATTILEGKKDLKEGTQEGKKERRKDIKEGRKEGREDIKEGRKEGYQGSGGGANANHYEYYASQSAFPIPPLSPPWSIYPSIHQAIYLLTYIPTYLSIFIYLCALTTPSSPFSLFMFPRNPATSFAVSLSALDASRAPSVAADC
jgi:hypothetical protein